MKWLAWCLCLSLSVVSYSSAFATDREVSTQITMVFIGHNLDLFGIRTVAPTINPSTRCHLEGYAAESSQPNYQILYAAVLLAFAERADVQVIVDDEGCVADRPKLIGLNILH